MKICVSCKIEKEIFAYPKDKSVNGGYRNTCKDCRREVRRKSRQKKPEVYREQNVRYKASNPKVYRDTQYRSIHKISYEEYMAKIEAQNYMCKICGAEPKGERFWALDHDHRCCGKGRSCPKCQRGVLCQSCNKILGFAKDNIEVLEKAIEYLKEYERNRVWE